MLGTVSQYRLYAVIAELPVFTPDKAFQRIWIVESVLLTSRGTPIESGIRLILAPAVFKGEVLPQPYELKAETWATTSSLKGKLKGEAVKMSMGIRQVVKAALVPGQLTVSSDQV